MQGLFVVGATLGGEDEAVASALAEELDTASVLSAWQSPSPASPLIAARHRGAEIDPRELVERAAGLDGPVVVHCPGGLLAALTPRYTARDLARELWLPVVVAVPATPELTGLARLNVAAARAAGLAAAGVVIAGWPDPPDRALLDERRLLGEIEGSVGVLPGPALGAQEWLDLAPAAPEAEAAQHSATPAAAVPLEPYTAWEGGELGDPRSTPRPRIMEAMLEIVAAEGPVLADRAYSIYNRASGGKKLTTIARAPLSSAAYWLSREGRLVLTPRDEVPWQDQDVLRLPDTPPVVVRELGPRTLDEVPLDEIAELMRRLRTSRRIDSDADLKRAVLDTYGLVRLTTRADEYLTLAIGLL